MPGLSTEGRTGTALASAWLPLLREALAKEGVFRFPLRGSSMRPTLPAACDIEIVPLPAEVPLGALVVFVVNDTLIAHRLVRRSGVYWIAQGDGRLGPDRPLARDQILGLVSAAHVDGEKCWPPAFPRPAAALWIARHWALRPARAAWRFLR
jgi:hypothetical protein